MVSRARGHSSFGVWWSAPEPCSSASLCTITRILVRNLFSWGAGSIPPVCPSSGLEGTSSYEQGWNSQCFLSLNLPSSKGGPPCQRENHLGAGCGRGGEGTKRVDGLGNANINAGVE